MTTEQLQGIADRTLRQVALRYGSTTNRDFRVIELVLEQVGCASVSNERSEFSPRTPERSEMITPSQSEMVAQAKEELRTTINALLEFAARHPDRVAQCKEDYQDDLDDLITAALSQGRASEPSSEYGHSRSMNKRLKAMGKPLPEGQQLTEAFDLVAQGRASQEVEAFGERVAAIFSGEDKSQLAEAIRAWNDENDKRHDAEEKLASQEAEIARLKADYNERGQLLRQTSPCEICKWPRPADIEHNICECCGFQPGYDSPDVYQWDGKWWANDDLHLQDKPTILVAAEASLASLVEEYKKLKDERA